MYADQQTSAKSIEYEKQLNARINRNDGEALAGVGRPYASNPLEQMERRNAEIEQEHVRRAEGIQFLRDNPQFEKFIELIRKESISI
jgi:hypothetical protein